MSIYNVIAYLLTDGGIGAEGRIYLANNSKAVIEDFRKQVVEAFGDQKFGFTKADNSTIIRFSNNKVRKQLLSYSNSYRTRHCNTHPKCPRTKDKKTLACNCPITGLPDVSIPREILLADKETKRQFLMRVFTADGGACLSFRKRKDRNDRIETRRMIVLRCDHPVLLKAYSHMLLQLDIVHRIDNTQIQIERLDSIRKFSDEINFLPGVYADRSKSWHRLEKRQILQIILNPNLSRPKVRL